MSSSEGQIRNFADTILFGPRLSDKLVSIGDLPEKKRAPFSLPKFPGRPERLSPGFSDKKPTFPTEAELKVASARGRLLHFFANHELLAMELMAVVLLRFEDAPPAFRQGLVRTIQEEQAHLNLYLERMQELGVAFGDIGVSPYFWNCMKETKSLLTFVTQMSLTFEQANLDFSLHYQKAVLNIGDLKTATLLEKVYNDEIGHVKHGLVWFNRWRSEASPTLADLSDWDAYIQLLPPPLTPRRAKGIGFTSEGRRSAGLSEEFIQKLEVQSGSKGRPPVLWHFNPLCEAEIVRGSPGLNASAKVKGLIADLEFLPAFAALETDIVWVEKPVQTRWLKELQECGFRLPEFRLKKDPLPKVLSGMEPWGWSPESFARFKPFAPRLQPTDGANAEWVQTLLASADFSATGLAEISSQLWSAQLNLELGEKPQIFTNQGDLDVFFKNTAQGEFILKSPWGTSGNGNRRFRLPLLDTDPIHQWAKGVNGVLNSQGAVIIEHWLDKIADLSMQIEINQKGTTILGIRRFYVGSQLQYRGTDLDPRLVSLGPEALRYLHAGPLEEWRSLARMIGSKLRTRGYEGPAGIDAILHRTPQGDLKLRPVIEINPRWTMGRLALEIEKRVAPGIPARWAFEPARSWPRTRVQEMRANHPSKLHTNGKMIESGIVFTNDPELATEVQTLLLVGDSALQVL